MPILGKRLEQHKIYHETWIGEITTEDVVHSATQRKTWATEDGCINEYYIIIDGEKCTKLAPISGLISAAKIHPADGVEMVGINVPPFPRLIAKMFGKFAAQPLTVLDTYDDAMAYINKRIAEKNTSDKETA